MELGELIIESNPQLIWKSILKNGIGISGLNIGLTIKRSIDNYYWQDTLWGVSGYIVYMTEVDVLENPGLYTWTIPSGFLGVSTRTGFKIQYYASGVLNMSQSYYSLEDYPGGTSDDSILVQAIYKNTKGISEQCDELIKKIKYSH